MVLPEQARLALETAVLIDEAVEAAIPARTRTPAMRIAAAS
jgi:hypothetical protein